ARRRPSAPGTAGGGPRGVRARSRPVRERARARATALARGRLRRMRTARALSSTDPAPRPPRAPQQESPEPTISCHGPWPRPGLTLAPPTPGSRSSCRRRLHHREGGALGIDQASEAPDRHVHRLIRDGRPERARLGDDGVTVGDREDHAPVRWDLGRKVLVGHLHHAANLFPVHLPDGVGLGRALERGGTPLPTEDGRVERLVCVGVTGEHLVPAERARLVCEIGSGEALWLPHAEHGTGGIGEERHPSDVHHIAAGRLDLPSSLIRISDAYIGRPRGGLALLHMTHQAGDVLALLLEHAISAGLLAAWLGRAPAHELAIELRGGVGVWGGQFHPGRGAWCVLGHGFSFRGRDFIREWHISAWNARLFSSNPPGDPLWGARRVRAHTQPALTRARACEKSSVVLRWMK